MASATVLAFGLSDAGVRHASAATVGAPTLAQAAKTHEGQGTVISIDAAKGQVVIDHGPIEGMMDAMVMGFPVADPKLLEGVAEGDGVRFMLRASDSTIVEMVVDPSAKAASGSGKAGHGMKTKAEGGAHGGHMTVSGGHGETGIDHDRPDAQAPVGVMGDHIHHPGSWTISYKYMRMTMEGNRDGTDELSPEEIVTTVSNRFFGTTGQPSTLRIVPTDMYMDMHMIGGMYVPADWLSLMVMGMYVSKSMDHVTFQGGSGTTRLGEFTTKSNGIGDTKVSATAQVYQQGRHKVLLNFGVSLPTGSIDETDDILTPTGGTPTVRLPYAMQIGSGTYDLLPGVTYTGGVDDFGWGAQYGATLRLGDNDEDYSLGNGHRITAWGSYRFAPWVSGSLRLAAETLDAIDGIDDNIIGPVQTADPDNYGGERIDLGIGLNFVGTEGSLQGQRFGVEATVPLYQDLNGPQMETDWTITARVGFTF